MVEAAWPVQARLPASPIAAASPSHCATTARSEMRQAARQIARPARMIVISPNWVSLMTVDRMSAVKASMSGIPLIDAACSRSQIAPEITARARQAQICRRVRLRNASVAAVWLCKTGMAIRRPKTTLPTANAVAAKCTARVAINGTPAADQSIATKLYWPTWKV